VQLAKQTINKGLKQLLLWQKVNNYLL